MDQVDSSQVAVRTTVKPGEAAATRRRAAGPSVTTGPTASTTPHKQVVLSPVETSQSAQAGKRVPKKSAPGPDKTRSMRLAPHVSMELPY